MLILKNILCYLFVFGSFFVNGQDIWLQSYSQPSSGCDLTSNETVQVSVLNNSGTPVSSNTINVSFSVDGNAPVNETIPTNLFPNASINFSFGTKGDLSSCQNHEVKVWVSSPGDLNQTNDTLTWWVQNDCSVTPGYVDTSLNVCITGNSGSLNLAGSNNGTIIGWEYSTDGGSNWSPTGNTGSTESYSMITVPTMYQVQIDGGYCPNVTSAPATITPVSPPTNGTVTLPDSLCISNATGNITLTGSTGNIITWETSPNGSVWTPNGQTATSWNYNLTSTTFYRALIDGNGCPDVYSDETHVYVEQNGNGGAIAGSDSLCIDNVSGSLVHSGLTGPIDHWEWSIDQFFWNPISSAASVLPFNSLTQTTYYRVLTSGEFCPDQYSDTATVYIQQLYDSPNLLGADTVCETAISGILNLETVPSDVIEWQFSDDNGSSWNSVADNSTSYDFSVLTNTTEVRVLLDGDKCPDYYSTIAGIEIDELTEGGLLTAAQDSFCVSNSSGSVENTSTIANIDYWEYSTNDGFSWTPISNVGNIYAFPSLSESMWIRSHSNGGECPSYFSDTVELFVEDDIIGGTLLNDTTVCLEALSGVFNLSGSNGIVDHWQWSDNSGSNWNNIANTSNSYNYTNISSTTEFRVFSVGEVCPGAYSTIATVFVDDPSQAGNLLSDMSICENDSAYLELQNSVGNTYVWQNSLDGNVWTTHSSLNDLYDSISQVSESQYFQVIVSNGVCPNDTSNTIQISMLPSPSVTVSADTSVLLGESVSIWGAGGDIGAWEESPFLSSPNSNTTDVNPDTTQYFYFAVIDGNGCVAMDSVLVTVLPPLMIDIKNVVTTNADGYNDTWIIEGLENFPNTAVKVFNVYGNMVYSSDDYQNDWDGTHKGKLLPNGTYMYIVTLSETEEELKGTITLLGDTK